MFTEQVDLPSNDLNTAGYYYVFATAINGANEQTSKVSGPFLYDPVPPTMGTLSSSYPGDGTLAVSWSSSVWGLSGASVSTTYALSYTIDGGAVQTAQVNGLSSSLDLINLYGHTVILTLTATSGAGVANTTSLTINVPVQLSQFASTVSPAAVSGGPGGTVMEVDLDFGVTPKQLHDGFSQLKITRVVTSGSATLPPLQINPSTIPLDSNGNFVAPSTNFPLWKVDTNGKIVYVDWVPISTGAGHKLWTYSLIPTPQTGTVLQSSVQLPVNEGQLNFLIEDVHGNVYGSGSNTFSVYADGRVQVVIQGTDPDQDSWNFEVDRTAQVGPLTAYKSLSGASLIGYTGTTTGANSAPVAITLRQGINNLSVFWEQGNDSNAIYHSSIESVDLEPTSTGSYSITVTDGYSNPSNTDSGGILTSPGAPLTFSVNAGGLDVSQFSWDFGDGATTSGTASVTHAYGQMANQTTDTAMYTLSLTVPGNSTPITLPVTVQDTQEGSLLVSEIWRGNHTVTGVVVVPTTLSLTIVTNETVQFQGGLGSGYGQGLDVQGTLTVADQVSFQPAAGQSSGWGTILIEGSAVAQLGADTIEGADRGVTVAGISTANLTGTKLVNNTTGLHVVGNGVGNSNQPKAIITGATITGNSLYGIKEDAGARPLVTSSTIGNNFRDYYTFDQGLLNIKQINALNLGQN